MDLYNLLDKKNLRDFQGLNYLYNVSASLKSYVSIFFEIRTAKFRGAFIGFMQSLLFEKKITPVKKTIFLTNQKKIFMPLLQLGKLKYIDPPIFYKEDWSHD